MPRPHKHRVVDHVPGCRYFRPGRHRPGDSGEVNLFWEELEALRLKDLEGLDQAQAAERMEVSRPTFQRILRSARSKVAQALIDGLTIRVNGGHFRIAPRTLHCRQCGHKWSRQEETRGDEEVPTERGLPVCPLCGSDDVTSRRRKSERRNR